MRVKSIITFSIISSFFLFSLISIWKILSMLQGIELKTLNFNFYFLSGIIISFVSIFLSEKLNIILDYIWLFGYSSIISIFLRFISKLLFSSSFIFMLIKYSIYQYF